LSKHKSSSGIGFLGLLALILIGLKLAGIGVVASWSWWAVLAPLWIPWVIVLAVAIPAFVVIAVERAWSRR